MSVINQIKKGSDVYSIQDINAIVNPSEKSDGQLLTYNSSSGTWVAANAPASGVTSVTAGDKSITIGGTASAPTVAAKISPDANNGLSVKSNGLYAAATDLSGVEGRLDTIEGKEAGWDAKYDKPAGGIPDSDIASASTWNNVVSVVPSAATSSNKLVSQSEMGDAIASVEAKQLYKTNAQGSFETKAELLAATTFYDAAGNTATPTKNDVAYVLADESHDNKSAKYVIAAVSSGTITWGFVIAFSDVTFSTAQMATINSGLAAADKTKLDGIATGATAVTSSTVTGWGFKRIAFGSGTPSGLEAGDLWFQG